MLLLPLSGWVIVASRQGREQGVGEVGISDIRGWWGLNKKGGLRAAKVKTTLPLWHPVAHLQLVEDLQLAGQPGGEVLPPLAGGLAPGHLGRG